MGHAKDLKKVFAAAFAKSTANKGCMKGDLNSKRNKVRRTQSKYLVKETRLGEHRVSSSVLAQQTIYFILIHTQIRIPR